MTRTSTNRHLAIVVNGEAVSVTPAPLAEVLETLGYNLACAAVAVNDTIVFRRDLPRTTVCDGDCVEVLAPMSGG